MAVTHKDIARRSNVSRAAVSQVLRNPDHPRFPPATRRRILEAARSLNYVPNRLAAGLREGHTRTISLVMPYNVPELMDAAEQVANRLGYAFLIQFTYKPDFEAESRALQAALERRVDGIIWHPAATPEQYEPLARQLALDKAQVVLLERSLPQLPRADVVRTGTQAAAKAAFDHLREQGYEQLVYLTDSLAYPLRQCRAEEVAAHWPDVVIRSAGNQRQHAEEIRRLLQKMGRPLGVYCDSDWIAVRLLHLLEQEQIPCPEEVGLVALNDLLVGEFRVGELTRPTVSAVRRHHDQLGRMCVEQLIKRLNDDESGQRPAHGDELVVEPTLVPRQSSSRLASRQTESEKPVKTLRSAKRKK